MQWLETLLADATPFDLAVAGFTLFSTGIAFGFFVGRLVEYLRSPVLRQLTTDLEETRANLTDVSAINAEIEPQLANLNNLRAALGGQEDELWKLHGSDAPKSVRERLADGVPKIFTVMNLKGGVGKTTTVANLAAHFGKAGKRVLVIDLDYQGSLSRMLISAANIRTAADDEPLAIQFLSKQSDFRALRRQVTSLHPKLLNVDLVTCGIKFDKFENRAMLSWMIGDESDDVRYRLARVLTSEPFREFDLVLIDAPPRMSTGAINALLTSHGLLIPTVLDQLSATAIGPLIDRMNQIRPMNPSLQFAGAIGALRGAYGPQIVLAARATAEDSLKRWQGNRHLFQSEIRYFTNLAREAGSNVGYLKHSDVREVYQELAAEIAEKLHL